MFTFFKALTTPFQALRDQGSLASGRPPEGVFPVAEYLELPRFGSYVLAFNGAKIIELGSRRCIISMRPRYFTRKPWYLEVTPKQVDKAYGA